MRRSSRSTVPLLRRMRYRAFVLPAAGLAAVLAGVLIYGNLNENLVYYLEPAEVIERQHQLADGQRLRLGGEVVPGTTTETPDGVRFTLGDGRETVVVVHRGGAPQLFQEAIWVVVEGAFVDEVFESDNVMVMHDEVYQPRDDGYQPPGDELPADLVPPADARGGATEGVRL